MREALLTGWGGRKKFDNLISLAMIFKGLRDVLFTFYSIEDVSDIKSLETASRLYMNLGFM